ncbi:hypothetical protein EV421DRAFT_1989416 [Armillaria borealis]|uniref:TEA domain-containing protein n=1 Tax=Armillaria borealis TaxID=47425 RepID=A0AA39J3R2_9AGAR|nr:hypothetical protein EV421DRAFT_1989416 [Armillaria borealis]
MSSADDSLNVKWLRGIGRRKHRRQLKGTKKAVWPPDLELALLEGLRKYTSRGGKNKHPSPSLGVCRYDRRCTLRGVFISDYIYETTGKRRTREQVNGRLRYMRGTYRYREIYRLIDNPVNDNEDFQTRSSHSGRPALSWAGTHSPHPPLPQLNELAYRVVAQPHTPQSLSSIHAASLLSPRPNGASVLLAGSGRILTMVLPDPVANCCTVSVFSAMWTLPVLSEVAPMFYLGAAEDRKGCLYRTSLSLMLWQLICSTSDPTEYVVVQDIFPQTEYSTDTVSKISIAYYFTGASSQEGYLHCQQSTYSQPAVTAESQWLIPSSSVAIRKKFDL